MPLTQPALLPDQPPPPLQPRQITPLSVLQTARGDWQQRRRQWIAAGVDTGEGRAHVTEWPAIIEGLGIRWQRQVSIFDPVLAEALITWHTRIHQYAHTYVRGDRRRAAAAVRKEGISC